MKHMWSEEEIQEQTKIENLVDSKGRNRFIEGVGVPENVEGMSIVSSKWVLNGNNLIFEIIGGINKNIPQMTKICTFNLPVWVANKIIQVSSNIIDIKKYDVVSSDGGLSITNLLINKNINDIAFTTTNGITTITGEQVFFRFTFNTIIDNE